jgi:hypothetical protein
LSQAGLQTRNSDDAVSTASSGFGCDEKTIRAVSEQKVSYIAIGNLVVFISQMTHIHLCLKMTFAFFFLQNNC